MKANSENLNLDTVIINRENLERKALGKYHFEL